MEKVLVDTNVASYVMKRHRNGLVYRPHLEGRTLCLAFVSIGEFYYGAEKAGWDPHKRSALEQHLRNFVVLPYEKTVAERYAQAVVSVQKKGFQIDFSDAWIAATALAFELPLITHNPRHFTPVDDLTIITELKEKEI